MRAPFSLLLLLLMLVLYLIQQIPPLGFLLVFLGSFLWSVVLINAAFVGTLIEVPARRLSGWWLILPIGYFGAYWAYYLIDYRNFDALRTEIAVHNKSVAVPFDPVRQNLVFVGHSFFGPSTHHVPVVYTQGTNEGETVYRASYLAADLLCSEARNGGFVSAGIFTSGFHTRSDTIAGGTYVEGYCKISIPAQAPKAQVLVSSLDQKYSIGNLPVEEKIVTISTGDGRARTLRTGKALRLPMFPAPVIFCATKDTDDNEKPCARYFWRNYTSVIEGTRRFGRDADLLASVLGIRARDNAYDLPVANDTVRAAMTQARDEVRARELSNLDRAIADPMVEIGSQPFRSLRNRADLIEPRLDGIVRAIEFGVKNRKNSGRNAQEMFRLLDYVSHEALRPYEPRLKMLQSSHSRFYWKPIDERDQSLTPNSPPILIEAAGLNLADPEKR